ncbi:23S rRNA (pseudouridine(1915)-N(3))-methyltransferase RlmH [Sphingobacterium psychroaquaticum]|uniref:Ribosomal RNA large subunit methyltransferase H n=1 Tax=Sphingobacterium psychroaquaticum TaxID=561061 RepID=A0A1X7L689_9SPHI|nr:23S rRNA (pseudouridine(1915)-N(3))-methyltransferase RlmH [Sphingobacterium psychroaquaticum]QBQ42270.1 23S rRNA (pseudouridine(1915)-N(3))-methyltransferase RlmH [Sphingobacterium psychroaquaticum]SMG48762.1 23S rRNA (pseudouridine1915-N3)-methyltransferase [Sphingobacterium psychroaquaticum]
MKITLLCIGKTDEGFVQTGIENYVKRLKHYITFNIVVLPDIKNVKNLSQEQQKTKEGELILKNMSTLDFVVLLDERGKEYRSVDFSKFIEQKMVGSVNHLIFVIGGPYGFSSEVYARANQQISLSKMTFSHQMIRMFFVEQLYRAFSIMRGEPYHHE